MRISTLFIYLFLLKTAAAQEIALLDRSYRNPLTVTQDLTAGQLMNRCFPVYTTDIDALIAVANTLANDINTGAVQQPEMKRVTVGNSTVAITTQRSGASNTYGVILITVAGNKGATMELVKPGVGNRTAVKQLRIFLDYLKNNKHIIKQEN